MENIKANQDLLKDNVFPCCWSKVNKDGKLITNCPNTPTKRDEDNHQIRYFCEEHMIKVEEIRRKMAQKYINEYKKNLIKYLEDTYVTTGNYSYVYLPINSENLIKLIRNSEFDNE